MPNRTSLPSMLPPGLRGGRHDVDAARRVDRVAPRLGPVGGGDARRRTARTSPPTAPSRARCFFTMRPKVQVRPAGIEEDREHRQEVRPRRRVLERVRRVGVEEAAAVGAELLDRLLAATGPIAMVCLAPSSGGDVHVWQKFWIAPCCTMISARRTRAAGRCTGCRARDRPRSCRAGRPSAARCPAPAPPPPPCRPRPR